MGDLINQSADSPQMGDGVNSMGRGYDEMYTNVDHRLFRLNHELNRDMWITFHFLQIFINSKEDDRLKSYT